MNANFLAMGVQEDFDSGWAIIPTTEKPHYWYEIANNFGVTRYQSACGMANQLSGEANPPLHVGDFPLCKLCLRLRKAGAA